MKILLSAYSCEPGRGSEPGVGWNVAWEVAKYHEVWVLTRPDESKDAIDSELARNPMPNLRFVYFTLPFWRDSRRWGQSGGMQLHYYLWQIQAYFVARKLHQAIGFDVVHHVTFVRYASPSFLSLLPLPFIWGPVGGGESAPSPFWVDFSIKNRLYETLRGLWRFVGECDPFTRLTARRSALVFATTGESAERIRSLGATKLRIESESCLSQQDVDQLGQCPFPDLPIMRFISVARLLHWKGLHLGLQAFAKADLPEAEYWILGEGPELDRLQNLALNLGIANQVKFWGMLPRDQVLEKLSQCSALVHPSLHDSGGWVCLEAMASGRPIICLDLGGTAERVTEETGIKIPAYNPEQATDDLAKAMVQIAADAELRCRMGNLGREWIQRYYTWNARGKHLAEIYQEIGAQKATE